ncbi:hypothetical protein [Aquimarina pacifica]|uniref:hypothetical protein n=1 Tax=Aquimarina pacifica TaxID=1296415 RepID=UPI00046EDA5B|nr:hypothetical protein [Aquimarina pacifica]
MKLSNILFLISTILIFSCSTEKINEEIDDVNQISKNNIVHYKGNVLDTNNEKDALFLSNLVATQSTLNYVYDLKEKGDVYLFDTDEEYFNELIRMFPESEQQILAEAEMEKFLTSTESTGVEIEKKRKEVYSKYELLIPEYKKDGILKCSFYSNANYSGAQYTINADNDDSIKVNSVNSSFGNGWNDRISSFSMESYGFLIKVVIYEHEYCGGKRQRFTSSASNLTQYTMNWKPFGKSISWNDQISSLVISRRYFW